MFKDLEMKYVEAKAENQKMKANKVNFYYLLKECIKKVKKKKNNLSNALNMIHEEEDIAEILKVLKEFKIKH